MDKAGKKILIVDDEEFNLDILNEYLKESGFETVLARNGLEAVSQLAQNYGSIDAVVLDRMMPVMDGMQFMHAITDLEDYRNIPIIMQSAASSDEQVMEGLAAGVFYYLTKPYEKSALLTVLNSALEQHIIHTTPKNELRSYRNAASLLVGAVMCFKTLEEAKDISLLVAGACNSSEKVLFGLNELMVNAIEHGNLEISCEEKKSFIAEGTWQENINKRLKMPKYSEKYATLDFIVTDEYFEIAIKDMGKGFDFNKYIKLDHSRFDEPNGRGIAMAKMYSFDSMEYKDRGSKVICRIKKG